MTRLNRILKPIVGMDNFYYFHIVHMLYLHTHTHTFIYFFEYVASVQIIPSINIKRTTSHSTPLTPRILLLLHVFIKEHVPLI
jgi:hypothetical protein